MTILWQKKTSSSIVQSNEVPTSAFFYTYMYIILFNNVMLWRHISQHILDTLSDVLDIPILFLNHIQKAPKICLLSSFLKHHSNLAKWRVRIKKIIVFFVPKFSSLHIKKLWTINFHKFNKLVHDYFRFICNYIYCLMLNS